MSYLDFNTLSNEQLATLARCEQWRRSHGPFRMPDRLDDGADLDELLGPTPCGCGGDDYPVDAEALDCELGIPTHNVHIPGVADPDADEVDRQSDMT
jgi:hypothetical protein